MGALSYLFISILILPILHPSFCQQPCRFSTDAEIRAGFWFSQHSHFLPMSSINTSLFTHLYYYSLSLPLRGASSEQLPLLGTFSSILKSKKPALKTILSISTDDRQAEASDAAFAAMAADSSLRASFISSALELALANGFDGLDFSWRFPRSPADMANLGILLQEWRARIREQALNSSSSSSSSALILTATVYFSNHLFDEPADNLDYPTEAMSESLDWVNALCFGYHESSSSSTAHDSALIDRTSHFSGNYGITSWLDSGMPACMVLMGVPLYGRSWLLKNKANNEAGAQVVAAGPRQKVSNQTGIMAFSEIEEMIKEPGSVFVYDNQTVTSYFHSGRLWVSFDSPQVVEEKVNFASRRNLLGYILWPINFDDSNNTISKLASETWVNALDASYSIDEVDGFKEAAPPPLEAPQDGSTPPTAALSGSTQSFTKIHNWHLDLNLFLCFLLV